MDRRRLLTIARCGAGILDAVLVTVALVLGVLLVAACASSSSMPSGRSVIVLDEHPHALPTGQAGAAAVR